MSSNPIYAEFKPTYLYIKQHTITGKLYFGKTIQNVEKYFGSGVHWTNHIKKHGKEHVVTLWYSLFLSQEECTNFALMFSEHQSIAESEGWLNQRFENGLDGGSIGASDITKQLISKNHHDVSGPNNPMYGKTHTPEVRAILSKARKGVAQSTKTCEKMSKSKTGRLNNMHGKTGEVCCFNLITKSFCRIPKTEFDKNKGTLYVGVNSLLAKQMASSD